MQWHLAWSGCCSKLRRPLCCFQHAPMCRCLCAAYTLWCIQHAPEMHMSMCSVTSSSQKLLNRLERRDKRKGTKGEHYTLCCTACCTMPGIAYHTQSAISKGLGKACTAICLSHVHDCSGEQALQHLLQLKLPTSYGECPACWHAQGCCRLLPALCCSVQQGVQQHGLFAALSTIVRCSACLPPCSAAG